MTVARPRSVRPSAVRAAVALALVLALAGRAAIAADACPDVPDDETGGRRAAAKEQFAKAEEAEAAGDRQGAVRRYACSLKLVPHPSTAYNLGTTAEKTGDLSMAVDAFKMYLSLAPDADDRAAIEARVARLEAKLAELRHDFPLEPAAPPAPAPVPSAAPPTASGRASAAPVAVVPAAPPESVHPHRTAGLVTLAGGAVALGTGVAFNLIARSKMSDCYREFAAGQSGALDQCDAARPFAYGSYGLFALSGALGVASLTLLLWNGETDTTLAFAPTPSGGTLLATGRF
jgi:hypothetical protein